MKGHHVKYSVTGMVAFFYARLMVPEVLVRHILPQRVWVFVRIHLSHPFYLPPDPPLPFRRPPPREEGGSMNSEG